MVQVDVQPGLAGEAQRAGHVRLVPGRWRRRQLDSGNVLPWGRDSASAVKADRADAHGVLEAGGEGMVVTEVKGALRPRWDGRRHLLVDSDRPTTLKKHDQAGVWALASRRSYRSMLDPRDTTRSSGSPKWADGLAALRLMPLNTSLRHRAMPFPGVRLMVMRLRK